MQIKGIFTTYQGLWLCGGIALLLKGCSLLIASDWFWFLAPLGLAIGLAKGHFVLSKTMRRLKTRLTGLTEPISLRTAFPPAYLALIAVMVGLGILLRWAPDELRGVIDLAVGTALSSAALIYGREVPEKSS
jgi:hypothetical protein